MAIKRGHIAIIRCLLKHDITVDIGVLKAATGNGANGSEWYESDDTDVVG